MSRAVGNRHFLKAIAVRNYATQTAVKPANSSDVSVSVSSKNTRLIAASPNYPLSKVSLSFKAGSRYELPDNLGITHILRQSIALSSQDLSSFMLHRKSSQEGFNLYASVDREAFTYTVETHPKNVHVAVQYLISVATRPSFKPWELSDNVGKIKLDLLSIPPQAKTLDLLHQTAYRSGLGNSLFIDPSRVEKINYEHCWHFVNQHFTASRAQIASTGLTSSELNEIVASIELEASAGPATVKSAYVGGEVRVPDYKENITYVAVAGEAPGFSQKEYMPFAILPYVFSNVPSVKYGDGQNILNKALTKTGAVAMVTGLKAAYSDSSLIGFFLVANNSDAVKAYEAVLNAFLKSSITDKDIEKAKAQLKSSFLSSADGTGIVDIFSKQVAADSVITPVQAAAAIDSVTPADVKQAAKKLLSGNLVVASYGGEVASLPYIDTIKK